MKKFFNLLLLLVATLCWQVNPVLAADECDKVTVSEVTSPSTCIPCDAAILGDCCDTSSGASCLKTCLATANSGETVDWSKIFVSCNPTGSQHGDGSCRCTTNTDCSTGTGCYCPDGSDQGLPPSMLKRCLLGKCADSPTPPADYPGIAGCAPADIHCYDVACFCDTCHNGLKASRMYYCGGTPPPTTPPLTPVPLTPNPANLRPYDPGN